MIIDCISDLHGFYPRLEGGDLLIIAGDLTASDTLKQHVDFKKWLYEQNYTKKIVIAGNHDNHFVNTPSGPYVFSSYDTVTNQQKSFADYLCDSGTEFEGLKIWGSPWTLSFEGMNPSCMAFTVEDEDALVEKFAHMPSDIDILITHIPPYGIFDMVRDSFFPEVKHCGSKYLYNWFKYMERPKLHVFGHIHEGYGRGEFFIGYDDKMVITVNASHVNEHYRPINKPIRVELIDPIPNKLAKEKLNNVLP